MNGVGAADSGPLPLKKISAQAVFFVCPSPDIRWQGQSDDKLLPRYSTEAKLCRFGLVQGSREDGRPSWPIAGATEKGIPFVEQQNENGTSLVSSEATHRGNIAHSLIDRADGTRKEGRTLSWQSQNVLCRCPVCCPVVNARSAMGAGNRAPFAFA